MEDLNAVEILIVEDNPHDAELTMRALRKNNLANNVIIAEDEQGRGILGVIDGLKSKGIETEEDIGERKEFLRKIGYKF